MCTLIEYATHSDRDAACAFVLQVCWDCYDFEAAAAHEIGHLLGIAHPDKQAGAELAPGYTATNSTYYNHYLTNGGVMNASRCMHPWDDVVPGVPANFDTNLLTGSHGVNVRPAIMESFTTHNPSVCLFQDDYEALITLYPSCSGVPPVPVCDKAHRNIGLLRFSLFVIGPLTVGLLLSVFLHWCVERQRTSWYAEQKKQKIHKNKDGSLRKIAPYGSNTPITPTKMEDLGVGAVPGQNLAITYSAVERVAPEKAKITL